MSNAFEEILKKENLLKLRFLFFAAFISSFAFYYFMVKVGPNHVDLPEGRAATAFFSLLGLVLTYIPSTSFSKLRWAYNLVVYSYIFLYLYFLHVHGWHVFHRWSYFVVISIFASTVLVWPDYVYLSIIALGAPLIVGFFGPLNLLEQIHYHAAAFVTLFVMGLSIRVGFRYRAEVTQLSKGLIQNSKMAALGEMSAGVAHEINNPLAIIMTCVSNVKIILRNEESYKKVEPALDKINTASSRIARIVQGLLNFSRPENTGQFRPVDLREIVTEALSLCTEKFKIEGIRLTYNPPDRAFMINCDRYQILQILINLLNNAYDASKSSPQPAIELKVFEKGKSAIFSISDSGPGIPVEIENKIMQPFFTTKEIGKGTGLGLSISLGLAKSHGGSLYLEREVSKSCFQLQLPLVEG